MIRSSIASLMLAMLGSLLPGYAMSVPVPDSDPVMQQIAELQSRWARIKYQMNDEDRQVTALQQLEERAAEISTAHPDRAEPLIWEAIILATDAGIDGGLSALGKVRTAKNLLEKSLAIDETALDGSAYTSLGSLYYQVPGWPLSFGDDEKAEEYLRKAVAINPAGIDANYFLGDFLMQEDRGEEARVYLEKSLQAPARPNRPVADQGRRQEASDALAIINARK